MSLLLALLGLGIAMALTIRNARGDQILSPVFLFSGVHVFYIFPKVFALITSDSPAAMYFRAKGLDFTVVYMSFLCYVATIISYKCAAPKEDVVYIINDIKRFTKKMSRFSIVIGGIGILSFFALVTMNGGPIKYYAGLEFYQMKLYGISVWLIFLSRFTYPALAAAALVAALRPSRFSLSLVVLFSVFPLMNVIFLFRRTDLLFLGFIAIYALTVSGRIRINRVFVLAGIGLLAFGIVLFPYLRQDSISKITGHSYGVEGMSIKERLVDSLKVKEDDEIVRAAAAIENTYQSRKYGLGTFIWNSLINQFVPATLIGTDAKNSLLIGSDSLTDATYGYFDQEAYYYVAPMGFAQAYEQFGPFGWVIFAALGALIALIQRMSWKVSNRIFLMIAIPIVCLAASNDITSTPARLLTFWILTRFLGRARFRVYPSSLRRDYNLSKIFTPFDVQRMRK